MKRKETPVISVSVFGQACLDRIDATVTSEECDAMAAAWSRASLAIGCGKGGKVTALDADGDEMLWIGIAFKGTPFDEKEGLEMIQEYKPVAPYRRERGTKRRT